MAAADFSYEIPRRVVLTVPVPQRLSTKAIGETIAVTASHLRFLLGREWKARKGERARERAEARRALKMVSGTT